MTSISKLEKLLLARIYFIAGKKSGSRITLSEALSVNLASKEDQKNALVALTQKDLAVGFTSDDDGEDFIAVTSAGETLLTSFKSIDEKLNEDNKPNPAEPGDKKPVKMKPEVKESPAAELAREVKMKSGKKIESLDFLEIAKIAKKVGVKHIGISRSKLNNLIAARLLTDKMLRGEYIDETSVTKAAEEDAKEILKTAPPVAKTPAAAPAKEDKPKAAAAAKAETKTPKKAKEPKAEKPDVTPRERRPITPKDQTIHGQNIPDKDTVKALKERADIAEAIKKSKNMSYATRVWILHDQCKLTFVECAYVLNKEDRIYHAYRAIRRYKANPALQKKVEG